MAIILPKVQTLCHPDHKCRNKCHSIQSASYRRPPRGDQGAGHNKLKANKLCIEISLGVRPEGPVLARSGPSVCPVGCTTSRLQEHPWYRLDPQLFLPENVKKDTDVVNEKYRNGWLWPAQGRGGQFICGRPCRSGHISPFSDLPAGC